MFGDSSRLGDETLYFDFVIDNLWREMVFITLKLPGLLFFIRMLSLFSLHVKIIGTESYLLISKNPCPQWETC